MKKGFTLIELLAVLVILGIIISIAAVSITDLVNETIEDTYLIQVNRIEKAASSWVAENSSVLSEEPYYIMISDLVAGGYLKEIPTNPITEELFDESFYVEIITNPNNYEFNFVEEIYVPTGGEVITENLRVKLIGPEIKEVEINSIYEEEGILATTSTGVIVETIDTVVLSNSTPVLEVDTSSISKYTIEYTATFGEDSLTLSRIVKIVDTTKPIINFPSPITLRVSEVATFDYMDGVVVTDNSGIHRPVVTSGVVNSTVGPYSIEYEVEDYSGNKAVGIRKVNVIED